MATAETTPAEAVARRLLILAQIVEQRAYHPDPWCIDQLTAKLRAAAVSAAAYPVGDGRRLPAETLDVLQEATDLMREHDFHISPVVIEYAVAPALGPVPEMNPLNAVSSNLARQDFECQKHRNTAVHGGHLDSTDDEVLAWALRTLVTVHYRHERLAAEVAVDNDRPCNRGKTPYHLTAQHGYAMAAAAAAGPRDGDKLIAALNEFGIPAFLVRDRGVSYVLVAVDRSADEGDAHTGPKIYLYSGETADLPAGDHEDPWSAHLYGADGEYVDQLFTAQAGLDVDVECAQAALTLACWLAANADRHPRA